MRGLPAWMPGSSPLATVEASSDYVDMRHPPPSPPDGAASRTPPRTPAPMTGAGGGGGVNHDFANRGEGEGRFG